MKPQISVVVCAHNPRRDYLDRTLKALQAQTMPVERWELLLIDNASSPPIAEFADLAWHPNARHLVEHRLGLSHVRLRAFDETQSGAIIFVDDDNLFASDYLEQAVGLLDREPKLGVAGGKLLPEFESPTDPRIPDALRYLPWRDLGDKEMTHALDFNSPEERSCSEFYPWGAGMVVRKAAMERYVGWATADISSVISGRRGSDLTSGEDLEIVISALESGWKIGYFPQLQLIHLMPDSRLTREYLGRYTFSVRKSNILVLHSHDMLPSGWSSIPAWTVVPRKIKAYFAERAWRGTINYVNWRGDCGAHEARALNARRPSRRN